MLFKKVCEPSLTALNPPTPGNHSPFYHLFVTKALVPFKIVTFSQKFGHVIINLLCSRWVSRREGVVLDG